MPEYHNGRFTISTEPARLDADAIYAFLSRSYWAEGRSKETTAQALAHSLCFGVFLENQQIGLARLVTDYATFAWLCDVYILEEYRGLGLGKWLISVVTSYPPLQGLRRWILATRDAHGLYSQYGFAPLKAPDRWMERLAPIP